MFPQKDLPLMALLGHAAGNQAPELPRYACSCGWRPTGSGVVSDVQLGNHLYQELYAANKRVARLVGGTHCPTCKGTGRSMIEKSCSYCSDGVLFDDSPEIVEAITIARRTGHHPLEELMCSCGAVQVWKEHAMEVGAELVRELTA